MSDDLGDHRCDRGGLPWVDTLGGPHILVPQSALPYWDGAPMNASEDEGDYGRACSVWSYVGLIDVGPAHALVLGSEPGLTTFLADRKASSAGSARTRKRASFTRPWR